jgi:hypothetical protein
MKFGARPARHRLAHDHSDFDTGQAARALSSTGLLDGAHATSGRVLTH